MNQICATSVDASSSSSSSAAAATVSTSRVKDSPLSQWSHYLGHLMPPRHKREDLSEALISTLEKYSIDECNNCTDDSQNYSSIYQFLADCLRGKCPRELNAQNSLIVLTLLKQTKFLLNYVGCDSERKLMQNVSKENATTGKKTNDNNEDERATGEEALQTSQDTQDTQDTQEDEAAGNNLLQKDVSRSTGNFVDLPSVTSSIECHEANDLLSQSTIQRRLNQFVESCMDLPKVKKIKSCLNPLNVPVSMVLEEANSLLGAIEDAS